MVGIYCAFFWLVFSVGDRRDHLGISLGDLLCVDSLLHNRINDCISKSNRALDPQKVFVGVAIAELDFELLPNVPESRFILIWVAELAKVQINSPRTLDFIQFALEFCKSDTQLDKQLPWLNSLESSFVYFT